MFTEEEQLLLAMTEEITLIHRHGLSDELYEKSLALFGEEKTAQIIMLIITINGMEQDRGGVKNGAMNPSWQGARFIPEVIHPCSAF